MFWIEGWVEISSQDEKDLRDEHAWQGVMRVSPIVDSADSVSEMLFGLSKPCIAGEKEVKAVAAGRGLPANPSEDVQRDLRIIGEHEEDYGPGEIGGFTFASWGEIRNCEFDEEQKKESDWVLVFDLLRRLEIDHRYSAEKIRLVTWYNW